MLLSLRGLCMYNKYPKFTRVYIILTIRENMRQRLNEQNHSYQKGTTQWRNNIFIL